MKAARYLSVVLKWSQAPRVGGEFTLLWRRVT